jgi:hypothetical protein
MFISFFVAFVLFTIVTSSRKKEIDEKSKPLPTKRSIDDVRIELYNIVDFAIDHRETQFATIWITRNSRLES